MKCAMMSLCFALPAVMLVAFCHDARAQGIVAPGAGPIHLESISNFEYVASEGASDGVCHVPHSRCRRFQNLLSRSRAARWAEAPLAARLPNCGAHVP